MDNRESRRPPNSLDGTNFEPNGDNNTLYRIYRRSAGCTLQGNWCDASNNVAIQGWVVCSPNDC